MKNELQSALFHERVEDALDEVIRNIGGRKAVAVEMWPDKTQRDAHNLMDDCLNPERREKFSPSQILFIARRGAEAGCHALMNFFAQECGYEVKPISKDQEIDRLVSVVESVTPVLANALASIERLKKQRK